MIIGKIQLEIAINVVSSKDTWMHETHSKNENIEITIYDKANEIKKDFFKSLLNRYQIGSETSRRDSDFICNCVSLLHYKCYKINLKRGATYLDTPTWIKKILTMMRSVFNTLQQLHQIMKK